MTKKKQIDEEKLSKILVSYQVIVDFLAISVLMLRPEQSLVIKQTGKASKHSVKVQLQFTTHSFLQLYFIMFFD